MLSNKVILVLASLGLVQSILLSIYLLTSRKVNRKANFFLAFALIGFTIRIGKSVLNYYVSLNAYERNIGISGILIAGPFIWFYFRSLLEPKMVFKYKDLFHFVPWLLFVLFLKLIPSNGKFENYWNYGIVVFHLIIYILLSLVYLSRKRPEISSEVFKWCRNILIGVTFIWLYYASNFLHYKIYYITGPIFYTLLIYALTYLFLKHSNLGLHKYKSSKIDRAASKSIFEKIMKQFLEEQMYLENNISVDNLAVKLDVNSRILSQVINENEQKSFKEFINFYRVEHAKNLLKSQSYRNEKIATIGYDSAFGTTVSFNNTFKKFTKMTPTQFRNKNS